MLLHMWHLHVKLMIIILGSFKVYMDGTWLCIGERVYMICMVIRATLSLYTCIFKKYWGFSIHCPLTIFLSVKHQSENLNEDKNNHSMVMTRVETRGIKSPKGYAHICCSLSLPHPNTTFYLCSEVLYICMFTW